MKPGGPQEDSRGEVNPPPPSICPSRYDLRKMMKILTHILEIP